MILWFQFIYSFLSLHLHWTFNLIWCWYLLFFRSIFLAGIHATLEVQIWKCMELPLLKIYSNQCYSVCWGNWHTWIQMRLHCLFLAHLWATLQSRLAWPIYFKHTRLNFYVLSGWVWNTKAPLVWLRISLQPRVSCTMLHLANLITFQLCHQ